MIGVSVVGAVFLPPVAPTAQRHEINILNVFIYRHMPEGLTHIKTPLCTATLSLGAYLSE